MVVEPAMPPPPTTGLTLGDHDPMGGGTMLVVEGSATDIGQYDTENPLAPVVPDWDGDSDQDPAGGRKSKKKLEEWNPNDDGINDVTAAEVTVKGGKALGKGIIIACCFLFLGGIVLYEEEKEPPKVAGQPSSSTSTSRSRSRARRPPPPPPSISPPPPDVQVQPPTPSPGIVPPPPDIVPAPAGCGELELPYNAHLVGICPPDEPDARCTVACDPGFRAVGSTNYRCFGDEGLWGAGGVVGQEPHCVIPDACESHPCVMSGDGLAQCITNHLAASSTLPRYTCTCSAGWTGDNCESVADVCASDPCLNGAECRGYGDRYQCICALGWRGDNCHMDYNECILPGLCQHAGTCMESTTNAAVSPGEFECSCMSGYAGERCEEVTDHCAALSAAEGCQNGGACRSSISGFKCRCEAGYAGAHCDTDIDECASHPCAHDGQCTDSTSAIGGFGQTPVGSDAFKCTCAPGFRGKTCDQDVNECLSRPCQHGGVCIDLVDDYSCECAPTWNAQTSTNAYWGGQECTEALSFENPCHNGGQQTQQSTTAAPDCLCAAGWEGPTCDDDTDECLSAPCQHSGRCTSSINRYRCRCEPGYAGDNCEIDVDECQSHPCQHPATNEAPCTTDPLVPDSYTCNCDSHYLGDNCAEQVSHCASVPCNHGTCVDDLDFYTCNCLDGYEGENCAEEIDVCVSAPCDHDGTCVSSEVCVGGVCHRRGVYRCTCAAGWRGDNCAEDVDECISRPCLHGGACADMQDAYACRCSVGWFGENCAEDIDECASIPCDNGGECLDRLASYSCRCVGGWEGDNCGSDVDECASRPCHNGDCVNGLDEFTCVCIAGWSGNKCTIDDDECASSPCKNAGSSCDDLVGFYVCTCGWGWEGENCEESSIHDTPIEANGEPLLGNIERGGQEVYFSFEALPGSTYQIETEILGLPDSILRMYDTDHQTVLAENDDYDIGRDSFLEWTAPRGGTFFFGVLAYDDSQTGDFNVYLTEMPNPCSCVGDTCGVMIDLPAASVSFMPDDGYASDALCDWTITCPDSLVSLTFTRLDTELDYDVISLYDSDINDESALLGEVSGQMEDNNKLQFLSTGPIMLVEFSPDESQSGLGFEMEYSCDSLRSHRVITPILTDGLQYEQEITVRGEQKWFAFNATMGATYSIETELLGLEDTVMHLYDVDGERQLAENDDSMSGTDSYLEWTAPANGQYYLMVHAYEETQTGGFFIRVAPASGNPCDGGITITSPSAVISFMPDGNYEDDAQCDWSIDCSDSDASPSVTFTRLDTEAQYDVVSVYDGSDPIAIADLSGLLADASQTNFVGTGPYMHLQFTADGSVGGAGFEARYHCGSEEVDDRQFLQVSTDGMATTASVDEEGGEVWFAFAASQGVTYQIETRLLGLVDSVMHLYNVDGRTQLAENDDASSGRDSYLEWTCPSAGTYYVLVHAYNPSQTGDFEFSVLEVSNAGEPCNGGMSLSMSSAVINFMPDGNYEDDAACQWSIDCGTDTMTTTITRMDTELNYDTVTLYDGADGAPMAAVSGRLENLQQTEFVTTQPTMLITFTADSSVGGAGFEVAYVCHSAGMNRHIMPIATDGSPMTSTIVDPGSQKWFSFQGVEGATYQLSTGLLGLDDTIMHLFASDMETQLAENDDAGVSRESYIEWTCPRDDTYYVMVHAFDATQTGDFEVGVLEQYEAGQMGDPCAGSGATLNEPSMSISFMPIGNYGDDELCDWAIECGAENTVSLTVTRLNTERDYDVITIIDKQPTGDVIMGELSGELRDQEADDLSYTTVSGSLLIEFTSDETLAAGGFEADYSCSNYGGPAGGSGGTSGGGGGALDSEALETDGTIHVHNIAQPADVAWFSFVGYAGETYQIETELIGLPDTVMYLYSMDGETELAENDDADSGQASYLEWTCPTDGEYYILVHAYDDSQTGSFQIRVSREEGSSNPCTTGANMDMPAAVVSFMPDGNYQDDDLCEWHIDCSSYGPGVQLQFTQLLTEQDYDVVTIYDGASAAAPFVSELSGDLVDLPETVFTSAGSDMFIAFTTDESITAGGFEMSYACSGAAVELADHGATHVRTDHATVVENIEHPGDQAWFSFDASQGASYEIMTELIGLPDSVMHLYDTDGQRQLAENDDSLTGRDSQIYWTAPAAGTYFIMVHAYDAQTQTGEFSLTITETGIQGGQGDACTEGAAPTARAAVISFMPDGNYQDDALCSWFIDCDGTPVSVNMMRLDTEADYDLVTLFDGDSEGAPILAEMSGEYMNLQETQFTTSATTLLIEFTSDMSVSGMGFEASYSCGHAMAEVMPVATDGAAHRGDIDTAGKRFWYSFTGVAGAAYDLGTELGGLDDSVMTIFANDMETELAENDDNGNERASYLEWVCPQDGTYYVMVRAYSASSTGDFTFTIDQVAVENGAGDPCFDVNGRTVSLYDATIAYMPAGARTS